MNSVPTTTSTKSSFLGFAAGAATTGGTFLRGSGRLPPIPGNTTSPNVVVHPVDPAVARAYAKLVHDRTNPISYGWLREDGQKPQVSKDRLERHFRAAAAARWGGGRPSQSEYVTELSQQKLASGRVYYLKGKWDAEGGPIALIRLDVDVRCGETDAEALRSWAMTKMGVDMPVAASPGGLSGWCWIRVPMVEHWKTGELVPTVKRHAANRIIEDLRIALPTMARAAGYRAKIEVQGGFLDTECEYECGVPLTDKTLVNGALDGKWAAKISAGWFPTQSDVDKLEQAVVPADSPILQAIIREGLPQAAATEAEKKRREKRLDDVLSGRMDGEVEDAPPKKSKPRKLADDDEFRELMRRLTAENAKHRTAFWFLARARCILGIRTHGELVERRREVLARALHLYDASGMGTGGCDRRREARFAGALRKLIEWHDDGLAGTGKAGAVWFGGNDLVDVRKRLRGMISDAELDEHRVDLDRLAIVACAMRKNTAIKADGACPVSALQGMLRHFGRTVNGSWLKRAVDLLVKKGVFRIFRAASEGICRAFRCMRPWLFGFVGARDDEPVPHGHSRKVATPPSPGPVKAEHAEHAILSPGMYKVLIAEDGMGDEWARAGVGAGRPENLENEPYA